ncbi:TadE/TadG family type IV pilus assembly protein [Streptomyces sp. NK15101]|uniref:TadE/TadG family type IV pilus assembly protein n=1 Tax=Streptomyces sp. NK15101 TaxID=2873261 RepID=UPI001CEDBC57|nr:TadE/TadG family type IV pilus assembly protein [Streptomyces sp. NK15101]
MRSGLRKERRDRGQAAIEYLGFLPLLLIVGMAGLQLGVAAYAAQQAGTAARAAARAMTTDDEPRLDAQTAATEATSSWVKPEAVPLVGDGEVTVTVTVTVPSVVPFWDDFGNVEKTATMPLPDEEDLP